MSIKTYAELQTAIDNWLKLNAQATYTARIPEWIALAEAEINRTLHSFRQIMDSTNSYLTTDTTRQIVLPSRFVEMLGVETKYAGEGDEKLREVRNQAYGELKLRIAPNQRLPELYAHAGTNIEFDAYPDAAAIVNFRYVSRYDIINDTTNWLLTNHPDAYLYGALAQGHEYRWNGPKREELYSRFRDVLTQINAVDDRNTDDAELSTDEVGRMSGSGRFNIITNTYQ